MSLKRWTLLVVLALCSWGGWWFLSRAFKLARDTADQSRARAYIKQIDERQLRFAKDNPAQGFACQLDDLLRAGLPSAVGSKYTFELHCEKREQSPEMGYLVTAYPADKQIDGVWGFWVFCSDQSGEIWGELSRESMQDYPNESEKAGLYDFERICRRNHHASKR
ncbi:MAG: hypothetical protein WA800_13605 [Terriglobales bacterium]